MFRFLRTWLVAAAVCAALVADTRAGDGIIGVWLTEERDSKIEFKDCGGAVCGKVVWLQYNSDEDGQPYKDVYNPDASLRDRPILGMTIFRDLEPTDKAGEWEGLVYNPENGETYQTFILMLDGDRVEVKGCVLAGFICGSEYWTRSSH